MAPKGFCSRYFSCQNLSPLDLVEDELARDPSPVGRPYLSSTSSALSCNPILYLAPVPAPILALAPALAAIKDLFKQFIKAYLESN